MSQHSLSIVLPGIIMDPVSAACNVRCMPDDHGQAAGITSGQDEACASQQSQSNSCVDAWCYDTSLMHAILPCLKCALISCAAAMALSAALQGRQINGLSTPLIAARPSCYMPSHDQASSAWKSTPQRQHNLLQSIASAWHGAAHSRAVAHLPRCPKSVRYDAHEPQSQSGLQSRCLHTTSMRSASGFVIVTMLGQVRHFDCRTGPVQEMEDTVLASANA